MLRALQSPELVLKFQQLCGVKSQIENDGTSTNAPDSEDAGWLKKQLFQQNGAIVTSRMNDSTINGSTPSKPTSHKSSVDYQITSPILDMVFKFGTELGNEIFFITFLPFWYWNIDGYVARRVSIFWAIFMYLGQVTKDLVKWPRPASPPAFRLDKGIYGMEYGMPSTHTMNGVGIPLSIFLLTTARYQYPPIFGLIISISWAVLVGGSRIYLGMHSVLDVLAGATYILVLIPIVFPFLDTIDYFILHHTLSPVVVIAVALGLTIYYPGCTEWTTTWADTTIIIGVVCGTSIGHWINSNLEVFTDPSGALPYPIIWPDMLWVAHSVARMLIGGFILFITRAIVKFVVFRVMCNYHSISPSDDKAQMMPSIQIPQKLLTYSLIGLNAVFITPYIFRCFGIERDTVYTEI